MTAKIPPAKEIIAKPAYVCPQCNSVFPTEMAYTKHYREQHIELPLGKVGECFRDCTNKCEILVIGLEKNHGYIICTYICMNDDAVEHEEYWEYIEKYFDVDHPIAYEEFRKAAEDALDKHKDEVLARLDMKFTKAKREAKE